MLVFTFVSTIKMEMDAPLVLSLLARSRSGKPLSRAVAFRSAVVIDSLLLVEFCCVSRGDALGMNFLRNQWKDTEMVWTLHRLRYIHTAKLINPRHRYKYRQTDRQTDILGD